MCPNHLDTHRHSTMISLPNIRMPVDRAAQGFVTQLHVGEDSRFTEKSMDMKSEP